MKFLLYYDFFQSKNSGSSNELLGDAIVISAQVRSIITTNPLCFKNMMDNAL